MRRTARTGRSERIFPTISPPGFQIQADSRDGPVAQWGPSQDPHPRSSSALPRRLLDRIPNKREFLARSFERLGLLSLLERAALRRRPTLVVLTYHRIAVPGPEAGPFYDPVISATPESFRAQMRSLAGRYRIIGLDQATIIEPGGPGDLLRAGRAHHLRRRLSRQLRDGPADPSRAWRAGRVLPPDRADRRAEAALVGSRRLRGQADARAAPSAGPPSRRSPADRHHAGDEPDAGRGPSAIMRIIGEFLDRAIPDQAWFLAQLDDRAEVSIDDAALGRALFMGWDQVKQLADAGMDVGSHGHSHARWASSTTTRSAASWPSPGRSWSSRLGRGVTALAYPYGWSGSFTARTVELAAEAGYRLAFSSLEGVNQPDRPGFEPLALRRLNVGTGDTPPLLRARASLHAALGRSFL